MEVQGQNKPTLNQIKNEKPNVERSSNILSGYVAGSMNGGINRVIGYKKIMAGERIKELRLQTRLKLLTPLTPAYQPLRVMIQTFFVPNSRVWDNAEEFTAQRGGTTETKIKEFPNLGGKIIPKVTGFIGDSSTLANITDTTLWRDSYIGWYLPRINPQDFITANDTILPKINCLPLRGFKAIFNDYLRNKEYTEPVLEYKSDTVSVDEWQSYFPAGNFNPNMVFGRARKNTSYYMDYRTDMQGYEIDKPTGTNNELLTWMQWESKADMVRNSAEFAQMNTWDIISKLRGSKLLSEGKVQLLSSTTHALNYSSITQSAYNTNDEIKEKYRALGFQGAYSFTEIDTPICTAEEFVEEGFIHVIATVYADTVYESGIPRCLLDVENMEQYRPDLKDDKLDVIYKCEFGTTEFELSPSTESSYYDAVGFKRKYNQNFYLPNVVSGDLLSTNYFLVRADFTGGVPSFTTDYTINQDIQIETQKTYQFFEIGGQVCQFNGNERRPKKIWLDYTDFLINKNQVIPNELNRFGNDFFITGENQIDFVGYLTCDCDMPISEDIKNNFTKWGEH